MNYKLALGDSEVVNLELQKRLETMARLASFSWYFLIALVVGTILISIYLKKKKGNYKLVIMLGMGIAFFHILVTAFLLSSYLKPIYTM